MLSLAALLNFKLNLFLAVERVLLIPRLNFDGAVGPSNWFVVIFCYDLSYIVIIYIVCQDGGTVN